MRCSSLLTSMFTSFGTFVFLFATFYFAHIISCCFFAVGASVYYGSPPGTPEQLSSWLNSASINLPHAQCSSSLEMELQEDQSGSWEAFSVQERSQILGQWTAACGRPQLLWRQAGPAYIASLYL